MVQFPDHALELQSAWAKEFTPMTFDIEKLLGPTANQPPALDAMRLPPVPIHPLSESQIRRNDLTGKLLPYERQLDSKGKEIVASQLVTEQILNDPLSGRLAHGIKGIAGSIRVYPTDIRKSDDSFCRRTAGATYGLLSIARLLHHHGSLVPHYRHWRHRNPDTPLLILNADSHHDEYIEYGLNLVSSSTWAYFLNRTPHTTVLHLPSAYSKDTSRFGVCDSPTQSVWHERRESYVEHIRESLARSKGELWITIDYDYFCLRGDPRFPNQKQWDYSAAITEELQQLVRLCQTVGTAPNKIIPVLSPDYLPMKREFHGEFARNTTMLVHRFFGAMG